MHPEGETMGERFKRLREQARLTQDEAARRAGLPITTIRNWEQGRRIPRLDHAAAFARAIGCSVDALAGLAPPEPAPGKKGGKK
jgi:putative transcriptional regulator